MDKNRIIIVISGGALQDVYSNNPNIDVSLLDYDNMKCADENSEEYDGYVALEAEIKNKEMDSVW